LSALGMVIAPPLVDVSKTIAHVNAIDDHRLQIEFQELALRSADILPEEKTARLEQFADCRFRGQSYELTVPADRLSRAAIEEEFRNAYMALYDQIPQGRGVEIVTVRLRRIGHAPQVSLPSIVPRQSAEQKARVILNGGESALVPVLDRPGLAALDTLAGPALLADPDATAYIPPHWTVRMTSAGGVIAQRASSRQARGG